MIETICSVAGILILLYCDLITLRVQDSLATFLSGMFPVIIGGLITLGVNYFIQSRLFDEEKKIRKMDRRLTAYSDLLRDITDHVSHRAVPKFMEYHIIKAAYYGSPILKDKLRRWIGGRGLYECDEFKVSMKEVKEIIVAEIKPGQEEAKKKGWWIFWK
jgi:hypothetical protein